MSESFNQPEVPESQYGAQRKAAWLAGLQRNADAMTAASMAAHEATDHRAVTAGQSGLFGPGATGERMAAEVAAHRPRIGDGGGAGHELSYQGGMWDVAAITDSPCPPRADLSRIGQPGHQPPGDRMSPLLRHMQGER
jgi:hypothetical protein